MAKGARGRGLGARLARWWNKSLTGILAVFGMFFFGIWDGVTGIPLSTLLCITCNAICPAFHLENCTLPYDEGEEHTSKNDSMVREGEKRALKRGCDCAAVVVSAFFFHLFSVVVNVSLTQYSNFVL